MNAILGHCYFTCIVNELLSCTTKVYGVLYSLAPKQTKKTIKVIHMMYVLYSNVLYYVLFI